MFFTLIQIIFEGGEIEEFEPKDGMTLDLMLTETKVVVTEVFPTYRRQTVIPLSKINRVISCVNN
jgi:hypothetical protein